MQIYRRKQQPDIPALEWDGTEDRLWLMRDNAGEYEGNIVSWGHPDDEVLHISLMTDTQDTVMRVGDWLLYTPSGLYVSRKEVFEEWYEPVS